MSRLIALIPVLFALMACSPSDPEPVLLTVLSEAGSEPAPKHGLFERYGLEGPSHSFTLEALATLDQHEIRRAITEGAPVQTYSGPRLTAVLDAAGVSLSDVQVWALDGYVEFIAVDEIATREPILALSRDGEALTLGGYGPVMLVFPPGDTEGVDPWPWSVFALEVVSPSAALDAG